MRIEEQHPDVLQNIEFAVMQTHREHPKMSDHVVLRTYGAVLDSYAAEQVGREPREWKPTQTEQELFDRVRAMCETRLGRDSLETEDDSVHEMSLPDPIDVPTLMLCLKRLRKSVQTWTKRHGNQGYLGFIGQFVK
ncbi:MAG: hypothetical protein HN849_03520 [Victivallales bacterium]|nr:hypothetical protein [Victivallales bacterium]MBT7164699.1 hypothetical protein [Victivallales bacterium]MBT7298552.1 hypothetical protein [Victivallales bacterium]